MSQATGYFTHKDCWRHEMGAGHPECPARLEAIEDRLLITGLDTALERREATAASLADMELAHGRMHLASLRGLSDGLRDEIAAGGPCPPACGRRPGPAARPMRRWTRTRPSTSIPGMRSWWRRAPPSTPPTP